jgi:hypothetical protein
VKVHELIEALKLQDQNAEVSGELYAGDELLELSSTGEYLLDIDWILADVNSQKNTKIDK